MKSWLPVLLLVGLWTPLLTILSIPEIPEGHGRPHSRMEHMNQGGADTGRHNRVLLPGWLFGAVLIIGFVSLIAWPVRLGLETSDQQVTQRNRWWIPFLVGLILYEIVFTVMFVTYHASLDEPYKPTFFGPFPTATAWMLFGLWPLPTLFIVLYVFYFDRLIYTVKEREHLVELVEQSLKAETIHKSKH